MKNTPYPEFLQKRMDYFYRDVLGSWDGRNLLHCFSPGYEAIILYSNDYLNLGSHPEIIESQIRALRKGSKDMVPSVFITDDSPQALFERKLANWTGQEEAILCTSGYNANIGLLQAIGGKDIPIYCDSMVHMSLLEGARTCGGIVVPFSHNNEAHLERKMKRLGRGIVLVDSIYSTDGSVCRLKEIAETSTKYGCILVVDESHSLGLYGAEGAGLTNQLGVSPHVDFITASLSKAFCGRGGIITCTGKFKDYFKHSSYPAIFSTAVTDQEAFRFIQTLEVIRKDEWRRTKLHSNTAFLHRELDKLSFNSQVSTSQIIPLQVANEAKSFYLRDLLHEYNIYAAPFIPPATTKKYCSLRLAVHCGLNEKALSKIAMAVKEIEELYFKVIDTKDSINTTIPENPDYKVANTDLSVFSPQTA